MKRRQFIALLGGAAASWPLAARAQQTAMPVIGFLSSWSPGEAARLLAGFRRGLQEAGYVEGQNLHIAFRWAEGQRARLPALAAELVQAHVSVIVAVGGPESGLAAKAATATIPIVAVGSDPDKVGLVASLSRPGGNVTGVSPRSFLLDAKRLGLLRELVPTATTIAVLLNPDNRFAESQRKDIQTAAQSIKQQIHVAHAGRERDLDAAFANVRQQRAGALLIGADALFDGWRHQLVALAARHALTTMYFSRDAVTVGGLISYGPNIADAYRQAAIYAGRILKGAKPADLPVLQADKFELVINLKTAKALGLNIPLPMQQLADEVIE